MMKQTSLTTLKAQLVESWASLPQFNRDLFGPDGWKCPYINSDGTVDWDEILARPDSHACVNMVRMVLSWGPYGKQYQVVVAWPEAG